MRRNHLSGGFPGTARLTAIAIAALSFILHALSPSPPPPSVLRGIQSLSFPPPRENSSVLTAHSQPPYARLIGRKGCSQDESDEQLRERQTAVQPADPTLILYTSGTTGFPKGAMLTHYSVINNVMMAFYRSDSMESEGAHYCLPMPLFHIAGAGTAIGTVIAKMTLHPLLAFEPVKTLQIIRQENCAYIFAVPTMLIAMLQHPAFERNKPTSLKLVTSGGAPVPVTVMEQVKERIGADVGIVLTQGIQGGREQ